MTSRWLGVTALILLAMGMLGTATLTQARPFQHPFGELREYHRHWLAVCPNLHEPNSRSEYKTNCWASTWTGNEDGTFTGDFPGDRLSVHRNRTTGELSITFVSVVVEKIDKSRSIRVSFSNGSFSDHPYGTSVTPNRNSGNEYTFAIRMDVDRLMEHMKASNHMTITMPLMGSDKPMFFSLIGLRNALGFLRKHANR